MPILTCSHTNRAAIFACAQAGCSSCMAFLLAQNEGLIHACIRYAEIGGVPYAEAAQEGRVGLWRAILRYDPSRSAAFSTFAWRFIWGRIWRYTLAFAQKGESLEELPFEACQAELAEGAWQQAQLALAVRETVGRLPERLRGILEQVYGLNDQPAQSMAAIGRELGLTRERIRQLHNQALALLRLPVFSIQVRSLAERDSRRDYRQARQRSDAWLRQGRRRK